MREDEASLHRKIPKEAHRKRHDDARDDVRVRMCPAVRRDGQHAEHAERIQRTQNQPYSGARLAFLDLDNPLSTDAYLLRQFALIETQLSAGTGSPSR